MNPARGNAGDGTSSPDVAGTAPQEARDAGSGKSSDAALRQIRSGSASDSRDLRRLPKAHLHVHLEGSIRPSTLEELLDRTGSCTPSLPMRSSLPEFLRVAEQTIACVQTADDLFRIASEHVHDEVDLGVRHLETTFSPQVFRSIGCAEELLEIVLAGLQQGAAATAISTGLICGVVRTEPLDEANELARVAVRHAPAGVIGFGLVGDEQEVTAPQFSSAFEHARTGDLLAVPHAGETGGSRSVWDAVDHLQADRIAHGVQAVNDAALLDALSDRGISCDVCLTSNVRLRVADDLLTHPLRKLVQAGVQVTLNADDPTYFGSDLLGEYEVCRRVLGMTDFELAALALAGVRASGAPPAIVGEISSDIDRWIERAG